LQVYLTLCCALVASAAGAYLHILWNIGGLLTTIACFGCMAWLLSISPYEEVLLGRFYGFFFLRVQSIFIFLVLTWFLFLVFVFPSFRFFHEQQKRVALLMATALLQGASIGPLIDLAIQIDPRYMSLGRYIYIGIKQ